MYLVNNMENNMIIGRGRDAVRSGEVLCFVLLEK